jgi:4,5-DOPA dioxygenase extradiol
VKTSAPVLFVSHGGGPLPLLADPGHAGMIEAFAQIRKKLQKLAHQPVALVFVSAHWEASTVTVTGSAYPSLYYDYYGFPADAYTIRYPARGSPDLAQSIVSHLQHAGINTSTDANRGLDHGVFVPALLLFPDAQLPCIQLSLLEGLDAGRHLALGKALRYLSEQNVMIIGSGFSFHNMGAFFSAGNPQADALNLAFEQWLSESLSLADQQQREQRLIDWAQAPGARFCHPREEHLMPLHVCAGAADTVVSEQWQFKVLGRQGSCFWWDSISATTA